MTPKINKPKPLNHLQLLEHYIRVLSNAIQSGPLHPDMADKVQVRLDRIEQDLKSRYGHVADHFYGPMVELQGLVYLARGEMHLVRASLQELQSLGSNYNFRTSLLHTQAQRPFATTEASSPKRKLPRFAKISLVTAGLVLAVGLVAFGATGGKLTPAKIAQLGKEYQTAQSLKNKYQSCSSKLADQRAKINAGDENAVQSFNAEFEKCEQVRISQNVASDNFHSLLGKKQTSF